MSFSVQVCDLVWPRVLGNTCDAVLCAYHVLDNIQDAVHIHTVFKLTVLVASEVAP